MKSHVLLRGCLAAVLLVSVAVGVAGTAQEDPKYGGALRVAIHSTVPTLDWQASTHSIVRQVGYHIWETLVTFDENSQIIGQLADKWEVSEDYKTYTFHLREGVQFHRGYGEMKAEDVKASIERYQAKSPKATNLASIIAVNVVGDHTVDLVLDEPMGPVLLSTLASVQAPVIILPEEIMGPMPEVGEIGLEEAVGTGPFELMEWIPGEKLVLRRFENYTPPDFPATGLGGNRIAYLDEVILIPTPEPSARLAALEAGDVDFASQLPLTDYHALEQNPDLVPYVVSPHFVLMANFNLAHEPFSNEALRLAAVAALDEEEVLNAAVRGLTDFYQPNCGCLWFKDDQPGVWTDYGCEIGYYGQGANLDTARRLLEEGGYSGERSRPVKWCNGIAPSSC